MKHRHAAVASLAIVSWGLNTPAPAIQPASPPPSQGQAPMSPDDLDKLLAPIALYPDALVVQILQCAQSPYQVKQVHDWLAANPDLKGTAAQDAAANEGFDASFIAISLFPEVLASMAEKPEWTRSLGQAFGTDKDGVMASIQRLRTQAQSMGSLKSNDQQTVQSVSVDSGQQVIVIQPANPQVVYVPQYDPQVVYTHPAPQAPQTDDSGRVVGAALIGFAAGVIVGAAADDDDHHYYYACGGWAYARPVCYPGGYNDYYRHRENMANDYYDHRRDMTDARYDHRENMAGQRGENQGNRQDAISNNRQSRTTTTVQTQSAGDLARTRGGTTTRTTTRAATQTRSRTGAFSGYQTGATERASSARGKSSVKGRGGARGRPR